MPATNFIWSIQDSAAMYHTLGMKRKCPENEVPVSKRPCPNLINEKPHNQIMIPESNMQYDGDSERSSMDTEFNSYTVKENRVPELHPDFPVQIMPNDGGFNSNSDSFTNNIIPHGAHQQIEDNNNNNNNNSYGASANMCCQNTMIMDLQEECYSKAVLPDNVMTDAEYEAACNMVATMESEGAPDPSQYRYSHTNSSNLSPLQGSPNMTQTSNTSTTNLSPEIRPYISDYY